VLGFDNSSHGNSLLTLSVSDAAVNTGNIPTHDWPTAPLPKTRYPYNRFESQNRAEEDKCLDAIRKMIASNKATNSDIGAIMIEPVSAFENKFASPSFYKSLRLLAKQEGIPFVVDETRVGFGISGKMWAHEHWYLSAERDGGAPDIVTFGGRAGISGFYASKEFSANGHFDSNVDMTGVLNYGLTWRAIQDNNYLDKVQDCSAFFKIELGNIQRDKNDVITNVRGMGTFVGFDLESSHQTDLMQNWLYRSGIMTARCGPNTIGLRPSLTLLPHDAAHLRNAIRSYEPNYDVNERLAH
jgi:4-aminobutyrate aminotransferase/(S)-3-amino-2-methylpropionate transaminase